MTNKQILCIEFYCDDLNKVITIGDYLKQLLVTLWKEEEGFSGKRPFGNSGWQYDIYRVYILHNLIDGQLDSDGYIEKIDEVAALNLTLQLIDYVFHGAWEGKSKYKKV